MKCDICKKTIFEFKVDCDAQRVCFACFLRNQESILKDIDEEKSNEVKQSD